MIDLALNRKFSASREVFDWRIIDSFSILIMIVKSSRKGVLHYHDFKTPTYPQLDFLNQVLNGKLKKTRGAIQSKKIFLFFTSES